MLSDMEFLMSVSIDIYHIINQISIFVRYEDHFVSYLTHIPNALVFKTVLLPTAPHTLCM